MIYFEIFKIIHIVAIISWMAGLLYMPRLFVYHTTAGNNKQMNETFKTMENKLYKFIILPAMKISVITGLILIHYYRPVIELFNMFFIKLLSVFGLIIYTIYLGKIKKAFNENKNKRSQKFYRIINEVPTVLMIIIVIAIVIGI